MRALFSTLLGMSMVSKPIAVLSLKKHSTLMKSNMVHTDLNVYSNVALLIQKY